MPKALGWLFLGLGTLLSAAMFKTLQLHFDNRQILDKAILLIEKGVWTHFGNAATGMGFIPGSFMTAITALPMRVIFSPYSAMFVIWASQLAGFFLLYAVLRDPKRPWVFPLLALFFWLNPWRVEQSELYNPAYLLFFAGLHIWSAYAQRMKSSLTLSALHVFGLGLCFQVHFSFLILFFCSLLLWHFKKVKVDWVGVAIGTLAVFASLVPWAIAYVNRPELSVDLAHSSHAFLGRNLLLVYPILKAVLYWLRYGSLYLGRHVFSEIQFDYIETEQLRNLVSLVFHALKWPLALISLAFSAYVNWTTLNAVWATKPFQRHTEDASAGWVQAYAFFMFVGMLLAAALSQVEFNHWHIILCFPIVSALVCLRFCSWFEQASFKRQTASVASLVVIFLAMGTVAALQSRVHRWDNDFHRDFIKLYEEQKALPK